MTANHRSSFHDASITPCWRLTQQSIEDCSLATVRAEILLDLGLLLTVGSDAALAALIPSVKGAP